MKMYLCLKKSEDIKVKFRPVCHLILYFSSIPIFISNSILVALFKKLGWNLIFVDANTFLFMQLVALVIGIGVAVTATIKYMNNDVLISLIQQEKMVMSKDDFQRTLNQQGEIIVSQTI